MFKKMVKLNTEQSCCMKQSSIMDIYQEGLSIL